MCKLLGVPTKPKHRWAMEMACRLRYQGSPALHGCWLDESINAELRGVCKVAHRMVFATRVLLDFNSLHARASQKRKREGHNA